MNQYKKKHSRPFHIQIEFGQSQVSLCPCNCEQCETQTSNFLEDIDHDPSYSSEKEELQELLKSIGDERYRVLSMEEDYYFTSRIGEKAQKKHRKKFLTVKCRHDNNENDSCGDTPDKTNNQKIAKKRGAKRIKILPQVRMINFESDKNLEERREKNYLRKNHRDATTRIDNDTDTDTDDSDIPSAESLGLENGPLYDRLLSIMQGDDITPEDYDLLLLLDKNNEKKTMNDKEIAQISTVVLGSENRNIIQNWGSSTCDICLESFKELPEGTEVRHLPCNHVFCKKCIDHWFSEVSIKCPTLSCYWQRER